MSDLSKRVFVTGGSKGLGLALCIRLLSQGYRITTTARHVTDGVRDLEQQYKGSFLFIEADLSDERDVIRLGREAQLLSGNYDGFVANAAVGTEGLLTLTSNATLRRSLEVNLFSVIALTREVIKGMLGTGGNLVFISSVAAQRGFKGLSVYAAAKAGLLGFSKSIAHEYGERNIRSNVVLPGFLETEMSDSLSDIQKSRIANRTALKRLGQPGDVVDMIEFLLSERSKFITGAEFVVDGGG